LNKVQFALIDISRHFYRKLRPEQVGGRS